MATNTDHDVADDGEEGDGAEDDAPERGAHVVPAGVICRQPRPQLRPRPRPQPARGHGGHPPAAAAGVAAGPGLQLLSQLVTAALQHTGSLKHSHNVMFDLIS